MRHLEKPRRALYLLGLLAYALVGLVWLSVTPGGLRESFREGFDD